MTHPGTGAKTSCLACLHGYMHELSRTEIRCHVCGQPPQGTLLEVSKANLLGMVCHQDGWSDTDSNVMSSQRGRAGRKAIRGSGSHVKRPIRKRGWWWSGMTSTLKLRDNLLAPPPAQAVYLKLVAQAHFTPPSFASFPYDFTSRIILLPLKIHSRLYYLCTALICTRFPPSLVHSLTHVRYLT